VPEKTKRKRAKNCPLTEQTYEEMPTESIQFLMVFVSSQWKIPAKQKKD